MNHTGFPNRKTESRVYISDENPHSLQKPTFNPADVLTLRNLSWGPRHSSKSDAHQPVLYGSGSALSPTVTIVEGSCGSGSVLSVLH